MCCVDFSSFVVFSFYLCRIFCWTPVHCTSIPSYNIYLINWDININTPCMSQSLKDSGEKKPLKLGPFGSENAGESFDDGIHSTVRQLVISYDSSNVNFIQIEYDDNGSSFWSNKHGQRQDNNYIDTVCPVFMILNPKYIYR